MHTCVHTYVFYNAKLFTWKRSEYLIVKTVYKVTSQS